MSKIFTTKEAGMSNRCWRTCLLRQVRLAPEPGPPV